MDPKLVLNLCYLGVILALIAIAIYSQVTSRYFDLPIPTGATLLTIFLPLIALINAAYTPRLFRFLQRYNSPSLQLFLPATLQLFQAIFTVVLATLNMENTLPGHVLDCSLQGNWQQLWSAHEGQAIQRIQDSLSCCGFRTVKHMAWPPQGQCSELYKRYTPCEGPWRAVMQRTAGLDFAVAVAIGILQIIQLVRFRMQPRQQGPSSFSAERRSNRRLMNGSSGITDPASEGLLENGGDAEEGSNDGNGDQNNNNNNNNNNSHYYGSANNDESNPRIHPSGLGEDRPW